jgi:transposase
MALNRGLRLGHSLWSRVGQHALRALPLTPHASERRAALLTLYPHLQGSIDELDKEVCAEVHQHPQARRLLTHPGVGPITALATEVFLGDPLRFADGKALASYIGMIPSEHSSGGRQRLGAMSKQGNALLRYLWCEAAMHAVGRDPELKRFYRRKLVQKGLGKARIAAARKLGIRLWIMLRDHIDYEEFCRRGQTRQKSGSVRAGMPDLDSGPATQ